MPDKTNASFGNVPQPSEDFGKLPHASESFRTVLNSSETFGTVPKTAERKENHILTVRDVARMFEAAGVARTERSVVNWCQANSSGIARLDAYLDPNEGKYFITPQSAEAAIKEEQAKYARTPAPSESFRNEQPDSEAPKKIRHALSEDNEAFVELKKEVMDLKIANRGKDYFIEQLKNERESFATERKEYVEKLMTFNRKVGELETRLLQVEAPKDEDQTRRLRVISNDEPSA